MPMDMLLYPRVSLYADKSCTHTVWSVNRKLYSIMTTCLSMPMA